MVSFIASFRMPYLEVIGVVLLVRNMWLDVKYRTSDPKIKYKYFAPLPGVRYLGIVYCTFYIISWILWFVIYGSPIPDKKNVPSTGNLAVVFFLADWVRFFSLPAMGLLWTFLMIQTRARMGYRKRRSRVRRIRAIQIVIWLIFGLICVARLGFGLEHIGQYDLTEFFDVCFRPITCLPLWIAVGISTTILMRTVYKSMLSVQGAVSVSTTNREKALLNKLNFMAIACCVAVSGRALQLLHCNLLGTLKSKRVYMSVKRTADIFILAIAIVVTWPMPTIPKDYVPIVQHLRSVTNRIGSKTNSLFSPTRTPQNSNSEEAIQLSIAPMSSIPESGSMTKFSVENSETKDTEQSVSTRTGDVETSFAVKSLDLTKKVPLGTWGKDLQIPLMDDADEDEIVLTQPMTV